MNLEIYKSNDILFLLFQSISNPLSKALEVGSCSRVIECLSSTAAQTRHLCNSSFQSTSFMFVLIPPRIGTVSIQSSEIYSNQDCVAVLGRALEFFLMRLCRTLQNLWLKIVKNIRIRIRTRRPSTMPQRENMRKYIWEHKLMTNTSGPEIILQLQFASGRSELRWNFSSTPFDASDIHRFSNRKWVSAACSIIYFFPSNIFSHRPSL